MTYKKIPGIDIKVSRIGLGTWGIGGGISDGYDESQFIETVVAAFDKGVNIIDTSPIYGLGRSEEIVGKAIREYGERKNIIIATKAGIDWNSGRIVKDLSAKQILRGIDSSLKKLDTEYIDIYLLHGCGHDDQIEETAGAMKDLLRAGKIRAIGVSNFSISQMDAFRREAPLHVSQSPYHILEREIEDDILPYCRKNKIALIAYGCFGRGLLTRATGRHTRLDRDHCSLSVPEGTLPRFLQYQSALDELDDFAQQRYGRSVLHLAMRWVLDRPGITIALWGARKPEHMDSVDRVMDWRLDSEARRQINRIVKKIVSPRDSSICLVPQCEPC